MKKDLHKRFLTLFLLFQSISPQANDDTNKLQTSAQLNLHTMLENIGNHYAYAEHKYINWKCINQKYNNNIQQLQNRVDGVLFFEHLLLEFADSHMTLNTNTNESYRLNAPISIKKHQSAFIIDDYWQTQLLDSTNLAIGAELITINGKQPDKVIQAFPTLCLDKTQADNQQWIINKALAGKYSEPRTIEISVNGDLKTIDLDQLKYHKTKQLLNYEVINGYGIIKINNSLGQTELIQSFDHGIDELSHTKGLILDLRNTISGGDSYIARAIIGRFIEQTHAYQKHRFEEHRNGAPKVPRLWTEYVSPRASLYDKPLVLLVNRWTGSMGEGLTIGLHGMRRGHVMGSQMAGLLGAVYGFQLEGMGFGYQMPAEKLFHVDGTPRELFIPDDIVKPTITNKDAPMAKALQFLQKIENSQDKTN